VEAAWLFLSTGVATTTIGRRRIVGKAGQGAGSASAMPHRDRCLAQLREEFRAARQLAPQRPFYQPLAVLCRILLREACRDGKPEAEGGSRDAQQAFLSCLPINILLDCGTRMATGTPPTVWRKF